VTTHPGIRLTAATSFLEVEDPVVHFGEFSLRHAHRGGQSHGGRDVDGAAATSALLSPAGYDRFERDVNA